MDDHFDIAIIGLGCAGGHVLLELLSRAETENLKIAVLDNYSKDSLHKTWSFWEQNKGKWDHLVHHSWGKSVFKAPKTNIITQLKPYKYKSIRSSEFINYTQNKCNNADNVSLIKEDVISIEENHEFALIKTKNQLVKAKQVFDSRISKDFALDKNDVGVNQHFKGWVIKTNQPVFRPDEFTMMDYNLVDNKTTSFTYVLPYDKYTALVEFTYFSNQLIEQSDYDHFLKTYIKKELGIKNYEVVGGEQGAIPMTNHNFERYNTEKIYKIGTAGGWVKPSTGYSFKSSETKAKQLVSNYIKGLGLSHQLFSKKYQLLDSVLLDVIQNDNSKGPRVFANLYTKNKIQTIFSFLDEKTTLLNELKIMVHLTSFTFVSAFFRQLFSKS